MSEDPVVALQGQVEALEGWRKQVLAVTEAADNRLRPLLKDVPGSLGRHVYEVAADEIERLRKALRSVEALADNWTHGPDCLADDTGHDPNCDCGLYGVLFEVRQALKSARN